MTLTFMSETRISGDLKLTYDPGTETFSITGMQFYDAVMEKS